VNFPNWNPNDFDLFKLEEGRTSRPQEIHEAAWLRFQDWMGRPCTVYAERMIPEGSDLPCILHAVGGAQTVRTEDLAFWADQGYACASFDWQIGDVQPREPERTSRWPESVRPQHGPHESLDQCVLPLAIQAAQITLSWLLDHPAVDATRVGMTGISWGGYLTWATAAYDKRIRATCPVFGCGIFDIPGMPELFADEVRSYWETHWDP
jgi:cephalosporin-C deacetylase-like acetyl esterase